MKKIEDLTEEDWNRITSGVEDTLRKIKKERQEFIDSGRFKEVLDYILWWTGRNGNLGYDVYQEPLLKTCKRWPAVSNEEFIEVSGHCTFGR